MNFDLGIASYVFGKVADFSLSFCFKSIGIKNDNDIRILEKAVKDFKEYINDRHKDNPGFESVMNFWIHKGIFESILSLIYNPEGKYLDFKDSLEYGDYLKISEREFSEQLMDELYDELIKLITDLSEDSKSTIIAIQIPILDAQNRNHKIVEEKLDEIINKIDDFSPISRKEETIFDKNLEQISNNIKSISLNIIGGFSSTGQRRYVIENFDNSRECIRKLIMEKSLGTIHLNNSMDYLNDYNDILTILDNLDSNEEEFDRIETMAIVAKRYIESFNKTLKKIERCLQLYYDTEIQYTGVIENSTDFKNLLERMLNRGSIITEEKKYQFFINPKDSIYFNVYLSKEEIDYINQHDEKLLIYAQFGGEYFNLASFNKHTKISIIAEMLLELVDKKNLPAKYYKIGNYLIGEG